MKKIIAATLALLMVLCMVAGLCACNKKAEEHTHEYSIESKKAEYVKSEATCTSGTVIYYSCLCGQKGNETFELDNKTHNAVNNYTDTNTLYHTTKVTCRSCSKVISETLEFHIYDTEEKNCTYCDHRKKRNEFESGLYQSGTETLVYSWEELISEGILGENGEATESGKALLVGDLIIDESALKNGRIAEDKYRDCDGLTRVSLPAVTGIIGAYAFADCDSLESVVFPITLSAIESHAFYSCDSFTSIGLPNGVKTLDAFAFANCKNVERVTLGKLLTTIGRNALSGLSNVTSITLPESVSSIGAYAFSDCYALTSIEYAGTTEKWNAVKKDTYWAGYPNEYSIICSD